MKKLTLIALCAAAVLALGSCNKKKTASQAAKQYSEHLKTGNYDLFLDGIAYEEIEQVPVEVKKVKKASDAKTLKAKMEEKGGIKDVAVKSENVSPDGQAATVVVTHTYDNGDVEDIAYDMILVDETDWKVKEGRDREVWRTHMADGSKVVFKLKEDAHREILKENIDGERDFEKLIEEGNREVVKVKEDGSKTVVKEIDKGDHEKIKIKVDGDKEVIKTDK